MSSRGDGAPAAVCRGGHRAPASARVIPCLYEWVLVYGFVPGLLSIALPGVGALPLLLLKDGAAPGHHGTGAGTLAVSLLASSSLTVGAAPGHHGTGAGTLAASLLASSSLTVGAAPGHHGTGAGTLAASSRSVIESPSCSTADSPAEPRPAPPSATIAAR